MFCFQKECFSFNKIHNRILAGFNSIFNNLFQRVDNKLKCLSNATSSSILSIFKVRYLLRIKSLVFAISLIYLFTIFAVVHINVSRSTDHITQTYCKVIPFLYHPSVSALSSSITRNPYFCLLLTIEDLARHVGIYVIVDTRVSDWYHSV